MSGWFANPSVRDCRCFLCGNLIIFVAYIDRETKKFAAGQQFRWTWDSITDLTFGQIYL